MTRKNMKENIELTLPVNAAYVSSARLTASSIANRLGFNIEEVEDIKAAVSEACTYIIKKASSNRVKVFKIHFIVQEGMLDIKINSKIKADIDEQDDEMSLVMIKALMDAIELSDNGGFEIYMSKIHKRNEFSGVSGVSGVSYLHIDSLL